MAGEVWWNTLSGFHSVIACRVIDASMISQMKGLKDENRRLKMMYGEMRMQAELLKEALGKK